MVSNQEPVMTVLTLNLRKTYKEKVKNISFNCINKKTWTFSKSVFQFEVLSNLITFSLFANVCKEDDVLFVLHIRSSM